MQQALRPYAVTGIAIVGAGLVGITPVARPLPDVQVPEVQLASASDLLTPYIDLFTTSFTNLEAIGSEFFADPLPFVQDILANPSLLADLPSAVFSTLSDPATITTSLTTLPLDLPITIDILLGAPLVLGLGEVGPLATTSGALEDYFTGLSSGDPTTVLTELIDGPANIANAFLNGKIGLDVLGLNLPLLNGVLVPDSNVDVSVGTDLITQLLTALGGDSVLTEPVTAFLADLPTNTLATVTAGPFGGLADALINYVPQQIAAALTDSTGTGTGITGLLDPTTLLSGLDLGNLGGLLDPSTLLDPLTLIPF